MESTLELAEKVYIILPPPRVSDQENVSVISCHNVIIRCYNPKVVCSNPVTGISKRKSGKKVLKGQD